MRSKGSATVAPQPPKPVKPSRAEVEALLESMLGAPAYNPDDLRVEIRLLAAQSREIRLEARHTRVRVRIMLNVIFRHELRRLIQSAPPEDCPEEFVGELLVSRKLRVARLQQVRLIPGIADHREGRHLSSRWRWR